MIIIQEDLSSNVYSAYSEVVNLVTLVVSSYQWLA